MLSLFRSKCTASFFTVACKAMFSSWSTAFVSLPRTVKVIINVKL